MNFTSLEALCAKQQNPYSELCKAERQYSRSWRGLNELQWSHLFQPLVCAGKLNDVQIYGRSFIRSIDGDDVMHCQSYMNYRQFAWAECRERFIHEHPALFGSYIEEECLFFGGINVEQTPTGLSLALPGAINFGHFIFEYLPRLAIFDTLGLLESHRVAVYDCLPQRFIDFMYMAGVKGVFRIPPVDGPAFRKVWVTSAPACRDSLGHYRMWAGGIHWLRQKMFKAIGGPSVKHARYLYIGRDNGTWRKPANEDALKTMLQGFGFQCPNMMALSAQAQIELVSGAQLIVVVAGAGSPITHFAPETACIIALSHKRHGTYWGGFGGALCLGQTYEIMECDPAPESQHVQISQNGVNERADFIVDLDALHQMVDRALEVIERRTSKGALDL